MRTWFGKYEYRYQPTTLLAKKNPPETIAMIDPMSPPYTSQPNDPRMMQIRIQWSDFRKLERMMNVAAKYDVPERMNPSKNMYVAIVLMTRNVTSHAL